MKRRNFIFVLLVGLGTSFNLYAQETQLTAGEIDELLSGNTISGDWGGMYKQHFATDGSTLYVPEGGNSDPGKWRVNAENNSYESWWESTGWTPYSIVTDNGVYSWVDSKGDKYPFDVHQGNQLDN